jgi:hypothetical protein
LGLIVRDVHDLKRLQDREGVGYKTYEECWLWNIAEVSDLVRGMIMEEEGGIYYDFDHEVEEFDIRFHAFDLVIPVRVWDDGFRDTEHSLIVASPNHPAIIEWVEDMIDEKMKRKPAWSIFNSYCFLKATHSVMWTSGPLLTTAAYVSARKQGKLANTNDLFYEFERIHDACRYRSKEECTKRKTFIIGNEKIEIRMNDTHHHLGTWHQGDGRATSQEREKLFLGGLEQML